MKILLLGDASSYHATLASGLRRLGHDVTVGSDGCGGMHVARDIDLSRSSGKVGGALLWLKLNTLLASRLRGYDIVQLCTPAFLNLRPKRLLALFKRLKRDNGRVFITDLGNSPAYVRMCLAPDSPFAYSEWNNPSIADPQHNPAALAWLSPELEDYYRTVCDYSDGVMTALYEYHLAARGNVHRAKLHYLGIPIDLDSLPQRNPQDDAGEQRPVRILSAYDASRAGHKGADILHELAREIAEAHPDRAELRTVCNVPYSQFLGELAQSDIVLDQLYSYTPATTALLTMACGGVSVSGGEEDYYNFISERNLRPIVNANPLDLDATAKEIERLIFDRALLTKKKTQGREFVELYHSTDALALRCLDLWTTY